MEIDHQIQIISTVPPGTCDLKEVTTQIDCNILYKNLSVREYIKNTIKDHEDIFNLGDDNV